METLENIDYLFHNINEINIYDRTINIKDNIYSYYLAKNYDDKNKMKTNLLLINYMIYYYIKNNKDKIYKQIEQFNNLSKSFNHIYYNHDKYYYYISLKKLNEQMIIIYNKRRINSLCS